MMRIGIVGAGFSGLALALQLSRLSARAGRAVQVVLIDSAPVGRGVAYGTDVPGHLLNVPARGMSLWPDQPDDFLNWWAARLCSPAAVHRLDFVPRRDYAAYLQDRFAGHSVGNAVIETIKAQVTSATWQAGGWQIGFADARPVCRVDHLVLAMGNALPQPTAFGFADPWHMPALRDPARPAFIMGTGLTMIDAVMSLSQLGHIGPVLALSRRGLVPRPHDLGVFDRAALAVPQQMVGAAPRAILRHVRTQALACGDWRLAIDSLRSITPQIWQGWTIWQKRQFLRHVQSRWDVHRHRMAPQIADTVRAWQQSGRLQVVAGRIVAVRGNHEAGWQIDWRPRGVNAIQTCDAGVALDCAGRRTDPDAGRVDPFVAGLLAAGLVRADDVRLGFDQDGQNRLVGGTGQAHPALWGVGPLVRGARWENTAVPELRGEALAVAERMLAS